MGTEQDFGVTSHFRSAFPETSGRGNPCWLCCGLLEIVGFSVRRTPLCLSQGMGTDLGDVISFLTLCLSGEKQRTHSELFLVLF